jgi:hypothetical protein
MICINSQRRRKSRVQFVSHREELGTGHGEKLLVAAKWGCVEIERGDDNRVRVVWIMVLKRYFEPVSEGGMETFVKMFIIISRSR